MLDARRTLTGGERRSKKSSTAAPRERDIGLACARRFSFSHHPEDRPAGRLSLFQAELQRIIESCSKMGRRECLKAQRPEARAFD